MSNLSNFKFNNSKNCCLAPYTTLNFDTMGYMRVCCYNSEFILGKYPDNSIVEAWSNASRNKFIQSLKQLKFPKGCEDCKRQIVENNVQNALFTSFDYLDSYHDISDVYPVALNFDFGNICNYECIMCGGKWSSSIRKNREKLPALKTPYDDQFVEQLRKFIPKLKFANFLGGEPFLNGIYYKIWDLMAELNPDIHINITTNGSVYNSKIESYLKKFNSCTITISLDSINESTYAFIRKNGNLKTVLENLEKFKALGKMRGIAVCPMIQNVYEMPQLVEFCIEHGLSLYINDVTGHLGGKLKGIHEGEFSNSSVWTGKDSSKEEVNVNNDTLIPEVALNTLTKKELQTILDYLTKFSFIEHYHLHDKYESFLNTIRHYVNQKPTFNELIKTHVCSLFRKGSLSEKIYILKELYKSCF